MSNSKGTPSANSLPIDDYFEDVPTEAPPSYDAAMLDPQLDLDQPPKPQRPPQAPQRPSQTTAGTYSRPTQVPPQKINQQPPPNRPAKPILKLRPSTVTNPNSYLPWEYPTGVKLCKKCGNNGYKLKNGRPCKDCWKKYRRGVTPPSTQAQLEQLVKNPPKPQPMNPNTVSLPPGVRIIPPMAPMGIQRPLVIQPGDPRMGGVICPRCRGRGLTHFFLDLETCTVCGGMGRVGDNGRRL